MIILNKTVWAEDKIAGMQVDDDIVLILFATGETYSVSFDSEAEAELAFKQAVVKFKEYTERVR